MRANRVIRGAAALSLLVVAACDSSSDEVEDFSAALTAAQTVPSVPDQGVSGTASFRLLEGGQRLAYEITFAGLDLGALDGAPITAATEDDVTKVHIHRSPEGVAGPHVLNIFGAPSEDDSDLVVDAEEGTLSGVWDDGDVNDSLPDHAQTVAFSQEIESLCDGRLYLNIHTAEFDDGILRGQIRPADPAVCDGL